jgi:glycosyltransferase involved in cell wall biosynthesis
VKKGMRLLVITSAVHYQHQGALWAYGPYVREIEMWADLFSIVRLAAPCLHESPPGDCLPIRRANVTISPKLQVGGHGLLRKIPYLWNVAILSWQLIGDLTWSDAVHVRNPGNLGLLGAVLTPVFSRRMVSKYAGQWVAYPGEPLTVRLQRKILASRWWRGPVTVYGKWPGQPRHVVPFFSSAMSEAQLERARKASSPKLFETPLRVLFVGRLSQPKNVDLLIRAVAQINSTAPRLKCSIVGVGPELPRLEQLVERLNVRNEVEFTGGLDHELVLEQLERAHLLVLVSESEGWPKALVEAMAFGLICIGSNRGLVPQLLGNNRGFVVPVGDTEALISVLSRIVADPQSYASMSQAAAAWAQGFSLERLRDELRSLLERSWGCLLPGASNASAESPVEKNVGRAFDLPVRHGRPS